MKQKRFFLSTLLLGSGLIFLIYLSIINSYFLSEDYAWWEYVRGKSIFEVLGYFVIPPSQSLAGFYHPLVGLSYWANVNFSWMNPLGFHLFNLIIHGLNYLLVVSIAYFFLKRFAFSLVAGILFIFFPFHSEAVAWIDGRHDLLTSFFYLLSFYLFLRWNENKKAILLGVSVFSFFLALTAKEMAVTLPVALSIFLLRFQANQLRVLTRLAPTVYYWLVLVFYFFLRAVYVGHWNPFGAASHLGTIIPRVLIFYFIFLFISLAFFLFMRRRKVGERKAVGLVPLLAILIGVFYFPAAFIPTQERYLYLPSTITAIFGANLFFLFWSSFKNQIFRILLVLTLVLVSIGSINYLGNRVDDWEKAGEIAQEVVDGFKAHTRAIPERLTIYFLNLPDNYHGSYIFRTHVKEAIKYGTNKEFRKIVVLPQTLGMGESSVEVINKSNFILKNKNGYLIFLPTITQVLLSGEEVVETEDYWLLIEDPNTLNLVLKKDYLGKEGVFFFEYRNKRISRIEKSW